MQKRNSSEKSMFNGIYRSRNGIIFGVCLGISEYFDFSVFWIRMILFILFIISGFFPVVFLYILAALIMKPKPVKPLYTENEYEFYDSYLHSRTMALHRLKNKFSSLNHRIQRLEDSVTSKEFDWETRFNNSSSKTNR